MYLISITFDHINCVDSETEPRIERGIDLRYTPAYNFIVRSLSKFYNLKYSCYLVYFLSIFSNIVQFYILPF